MAHNIPVSCLVDRYWDPVCKEWEGNMAPGTLIDFSTRTSDDNPGRIVPVGIVLLEDDSILCVPLEFIYQS